MVNTIFGMEKCKYHWIKKFGTPKQQEALEIRELNWAINREYQEMSKSDKILQFHNDDWVKDPQ